MQTETQVTVREILDNDVLQDTDGAIRKMLYMVGASVTNAHTRRAYLKGLGEFFDWVGARPFNRATVREWRSQLAELRSPSYVNQRISAVRKLVRILDDEGKIDPALAQQILTVKGVPMRGVRLGRWLSKEDASALLDAPDLDTLRGYRDRAMLAVMLGAGLRRSEVASLKIEQFVVVDGRYVIANIEGKAGRVRTVPIAPWIKEAVDEWLWRASRVREVEATPYSKVFRAVSPSGKLNGSIDPQTIHDMVARYARECNILATPHDLRRTFARHALLGGAALEQIQYSLGHASVQTTEKYLNIHQDFKTAPSDHLTYGGNNYVD